MKSINKLAVSAVLALSSVSAASAAVTLFHVTGSTAFRAADVSAEVAICGGTNAFATYYGSSLTGASLSVVQNGANGSDTIRFENNFTGSIGGDQAIEIPISVTGFPLATGAGETPSQVSVAPTQTTLASGGNGSVSAPANTESAVPDVVFSDVNPATTGAAIIATASAGNNTPTVTVQSSVVGIIPFVFVGIATTDVTDFSSAVVTPQNFTFAWSVGQAPLSLFTGNVNDANTTVFPLGRDIDSGTRATALAETGFGLNGSGAIAVTGALSQNYPLDASNKIVGNDSTAGQIVGFETVPNETIDGIRQNGGNGGYASGGNLAKAVAKGFASTASASAAIAYLGVSDATTALGSTSTTLIPYNGVTFVPNVNTVANAQKIEQGQYTYWGYEYIVVKPTNSSIASQFVTEIVTDKLDQLASNGVILANMTVGRADDGLSVQPGESAP